MSGTAVLQMATGDTSTSAVMDSGSFASIPAGSQVRLRSASGAPMSAMIYVAVRAEARDVAILAGAGDSAKQQGTLSVLWSGSSYSMTSKTDHRFARLVLTPGDTIELTPTPGTQLLLGVDTGIIEIGVTGGNVELLGPDRWPAPAEGIVEVGASHAANIPGSGTVHVRNVTDAPVTLVLVAIEQVGVPDGGI